MHSSKGDKPSMMGSNIEMDSYQQEQETGIKPHMNIFSGFTMITGMMIGAGIFASPSIAYRNVESVGASLLVWVLAGSLGLVGALCYAELGTMYPSNGGEKVYITKAFSKKLGMCFSWSTCLLALPISATAISTVFARYVANLALYDPAVDMANQRQAPEIVVKLIAAAAIAFVACVNGLSSKAGTAVQSIFTVIKVAALILVIGIGFVFMGKGTHLTNFQNAFEGTSKDFLKFGKAMYVALFACSGFNNLNYSTAEL